MTMTQSKLTDFATRYAAAWSGQSPEGLASFYADKGTLTVNAGTPSVGRAAIAATAKEFMTAFPDMVVKMDSVSLEGGRPRADRVVGWLESKHAQPTKRRASR